MTEGDDIYEFIDGDGHVHVEKGKRVERGGSALERKKAAIAAQSEAAVVAAQSELNVPIGE